MERPPLNGQLSPDDFLSFYWLKEELLQFLRGQGLSTAGSKQELTARISQYLKTGTNPAENRSARKPARQANMPDVFTRQSVIAPGWRCSQELRAFLEREIGPHFHFDSVMRDLIHTGSGKTLAEAIETWEAEQRKPKAEKPIAPQFEYNRHIRAYFQTHPGAALQDAIRDWETKKAERRDHD